MLIRCADPLGNVPELRLPPAEIDETNRRYSDGLDLVRARASNAPC